MKFSYQWLRQWVDVDLPPEQLADRLTSGGLEVDSVGPVAGPFSAVVVGQIIECEAHPDADKLTVCRVDIGDDKPLQVVCGAPNARVGLKMPFAKVGAVLGDDMKIGKAKLRGVESHGMCCSARELGLSDDHSGLMELPDDAPLGADVRSLLGLDDVTIALDLTPNRADCLGIRGLARDVAALCDAAYTPLEIEPVKGSIEDRFPVKLEDPEGCPRYGGRVIRGVDASAPTPTWIVEALRRSGVRSISIIVDITNYVMLELGQPMHAFDLDTLTGSIIVRRGREGEKLVLLDEKEVTLDESIVTICDESGPVALGGIMGGLSTGVTDATENLFLECAWFRPSVIAGKARTLGLHTDASHRFERGVDPQGQEAAIERMTALVLEYAGGQAGPLTMTEVTEQLPAPDPVSLRKARLARMLGTEIDDAHVTAMLERLGMDVQFDGEAWTAIAPSLRFDIEIEEDLVEEVARIYGYDALPARLTAGELRLEGESEAIVPLTRVRETLCAAGYFEAVNYSFVDEGALRDLSQERGSIPLSNPIASDMNVMRTTLMPGLLLSLSRNLRRQRSRVRLFETGVAFIDDADPQEIMRVAGVACGTVNPEQWAEQSRDVDYFDVKRDVESLLSLRGAGPEPSFRRSEHAWLHPGQSADVYIDDQPVGWVGVVHPNVLKALDIRPLVVAFELDLEKITIREIPNTKKISQYPSVRRDLAFVLPESVEYDEVKQCVKNIAGERLKDLLIFDVFSGQNVETGYKSLAIGLNLQDVSCTLTDEVVDQLVRRVIEALSERLDAQHRG